MRAAITVALGALALSCGVVAVGWAASAPDGSPLSADSSADSAKSGSPKAPQSRLDPAHKRVGRVKLTVIDSRFGEMLADRSGRALYLFTRDKPDRSRCRGACAQAWPPLKTKRMPKVGAGLDSDLIGVTKRRNGTKQVTFDGQPVYFYEDDRRSGQVGCQDVREFGGTWLVVSPDGTAIR